MRCIEGGWRDDLGRNVGYGEVWIRWREMAIGLFRVWWQGCTTGGWGCSGRVE